VESIEVIQKLCQFFLAMGSDEESVIYVSEPAYRFVYRLFCWFLLKILHEEIHNYRRQWWAHCYPFRLLVEQSIKTETCGCLYVFEQGQDINFKVMNEEFKWIHNRNIGNKRLHVQTD